MSESRRGASAALDRVFAKLQQCYDDGDLYHAHQMYRTMYFRQLRAKKYDECQELMFDGASKLLELNETNSGADCAMLYVKVLETADMKLNDEIITKLGKLHGMIEANSPERLNFTVKAIEYSSKYGKNETGEKHSIGDPNLHRLFAINYWNERNFRDSRYHFIHSSDGTNCARMLIDYQSTLGYNGEVDLFIAQAVLQYLCLKNKNTALVAFYVYTQKHPKISNAPPFVLPLLNFLWLLLLAIENRSKLALFTLLCEKYQASLERDPTYNLYLEKIGQIFFGKPAARRAEFGFFGNMMNQILSGLDDGDLDIATEDVD